ncbi:antitoxin [Methylobacterium sp. SyP6R]|uniref:antitoxin n=1 Tax=Methylobacterium sp. SyP6R TaxID=2718876 RepID=UPI001F32438D|nr:AbrB/MazE/SpoVT family DNA-binding domain-containing protein [Methylobacterium sp. SyP6R]MCF4126458.1 AbrB/MazE/SpoVT family DNA-binding domain-containing protein [Methylobacterium sp. SyP6R]
MGEIAKLFWADGAQAVRLPEGWRLEGEAVQVRREGNAVILEPMPGNWDWLKALVGPVDNDFEAAVAEQPPLPDSDMSDVFP